MREPDKLVRDEPEKLVRDEPEKLVRDEPEKLVLAEREKLVRGLGLLLLVLAAAAGTGLVAGSGSGWEADLRERRIGLLASGLATGLAGVLLLRFRRAVAERLIPLLAGALTLAAVLAVVVAVDVGRAYRLLVPSGGGRHDGSSCILEDELLGWRYRPGSVCRHSLPGNFDASYRIDASGNREIPFAGEAERRVFFFGDSYTFGHGVSDQETFSHRIATEHLSPRIQVVNAGVSGYGLAQIYGRLLRQRARIRPGDLVVVCPISDDLSRTLGGVDVLMQLAFEGSAYPRFVDGELLPEQVGSPGDRVRALLLSGPLTRDFFRFVHRAVFAPPDLEEGHAVVAAARELVRERGADFALLFLPRINEMKDGSYRRDVSSFEFPDLRGHFPRDEEQLATHRFPGDGHWNARGHAVAARAIVEVLAEGGWLEPRELRSP